MILSLFIKVSTGRLVLLLIEFFKGIRCYLMYLWEECDTMPNLALFSSVRVNKFKKLWTVLVYYLCCELWIFHHWMPMHFFIFSLLFLHLSLLFSDDIHNSSAGPISKTDEQSLLSRILHQTAQWVFLGLLMLLKRKKNTLELVVSTLIISPHCLHSGLNDLWLFNKNSCHLLYQVPGGLAQHKCLTYEGGYKTIKLNRSRWNKVSLVG